MIKILPNNYYEIIEDDFSWIVDMVWLIIYLQTKDYENNRQTIKRLSNWV